MKEKPTVPQLDGARLQPADLDHLPRKLVDAFHRSTTAMGLTEDGIGNIYRALAHNPALAESWMRFAGYISVGSGLSPRERELVILRVGAVRETDYEWVHHARLAVSAGLTSGEIEATKKPIPEWTWSVRDGALLTATDQLIDGCDIDDATWEILETFMTPRRLLDLVFTVGNYTTIAMLIKTLRVDLEPGVVNP